MGYVSHCNKHGQYKGDYCEDCIDELRKENTKLREALKKIADGDVAQSSIKGNVDEAYQQIKIEREKMIYKAPTSGFYQVSAEATTYEPTGEFETVSNPNTNGIPHGDLKPLPEKSTKKSSMKWV